jgi:hypothetical protein
MKMELSCSPGGRDGRVGNMQRAFSELNSSSSARGLIIVGGSHGTLALSLSFGGGAARAQELRADGSENALGGSGSACARDKGSRNL